MLRLGFCYQGRKMGYFERMRENMENRVLRARYLHNYFAFLDEGRPMVFFVDEMTWLNKNMVERKCWMDGRGRKTWRTRCRRERVRGGMRGDEERVEDVEGDGEKTRIITRR
jgi:hypothetical protein